MKKLIVSGLTASALLVGCGAQDAIDATKGMPKRIDDTNAQVAKTNAQILKTNQTMDGMSEDIAETREGIRMQKLFLAKESILDPQNTKQLLPPTHMLPAGKKFAEAATPEELVELTYTWLTLGIDKVFPIQKNPTTAEETAAVIAEAKGVYRDMSVLAVAMRIVAGMTSDDKVAEIIEQQIIGQGRYYRSALQFLAMRATFIMEFKLKASLLGNPMESIGAFEDALKYLGQLQVIANLSFVDQIAYQTRVNVFGPVVFQQDVTAAEVFGKNNRKLKGVWRALNRNFKAYKQANGQRISKGIADRIAMVEKQLAAAKPQ